MIYRFILFPYVKTYIIDGKKADKKHLEQIPASFLENVDFSNDTLYVRVRQNVNDKESSSEVLTDEMKWLHTQFAAPNSDIIYRYLHNAKISDFSTYDKDLLITLDLYLHTPDQVAKAVNDNFRSIKIVGLGEFITAKVDTVDKEYIGQNIEDMKRSYSFDYDENKYKTLDELLKESGIPANELNEVYCDKDKIVLISFPEKR